MALELTPTQVYVTMLALEHAQLTAAPSLPPWHKQALMDAWATCHAAYEDNMKKDAG